MKKIQNSNRDKFEELFDYFHLSSNKLHDYSGGGFRFTPQTPDAVFTYNGFAIEDNFTERISLAGSIAEAHDAIDNLPREYIYAAGGILDNDQEKEIIDISDKFENCYTDLSHDDNEYGTNFDFSFYMYHAGLMDRRKVKEKYVNEVLRENELEKIYHEFADNRQQNHIKPVANTLQNDDFKEKIIPELPELYGHYERATFDLEEIMRVPGINWADWSVNREFDKQIVEAFEDIFETYESEVDEFGEKSDQFLRFLSKYAKNELQVEGPSDLHARHRRMWKGCVPDAQKHGEIWTTDPVDLVHVATVQTPHNYASTDLLVPDRFASELEESSVLQEGVHDKLKQAVVYHGTFSERNVKKIVEDGFDPGKGDTYGKGLYTVYDLDDSATEKGVYGNYLIKFRIPITNKYLVFDPSVAKSLYGDDDSLRDQLQKFDLNFRKGFIRQLEDKQRRDIQSDAAQMFIKKVGKEKISKIFDGIIYTGRKDGKTLVCYNTNDAQALGWKELGEYKEVDAQNLEKGDSFEFKDEYQDKHKVYSEAVATVRDVYETRREKEQDEYFFSWEDLKPISFHESTNTQFDNAEAGDMYRINEKVLIYTGNKGYNDLTKPPFRKFDLQFVDRESKKEARVYFTDGANEEWQESRSKIIAKDPHIDTFRRSGNNIFNMMEASEEVKEKVREVAKDDLMYKDDVSERIEEAKNRMHIPPRYLTEYMQPLDTRDRWYKQIGPHELPKEVEAERKPGFASVAPKLREVKRRIDEQKESKELQYFRRFVKQLKSYNNLDKNFDSAPDNRKESLIRKVNEKAKNIFEFIDKGSMRNVYQLPKAGMILKIARYSLMGVESSIKANKAEANNIYHTAYPDIFPNVYGRGEDGIWIVMEEVEVLKTTEEIIEQLPKFYELYQEVNEVAGLKARSFLRLMWGLLGEFYIDYLDAKRKPYSKEYKEKWEDEVMHAVMASYVAEPSKKPEAKKLARKTIEVLKDPDDTYKKIMMAYNEFNIELNDLRDHNMGVDSDGNLVILDISAFN